MLQRALPPQNRMNSTFSFKSTEAKQIERQEIQWIFPPNRRDDLWLCFSLHPSSTVCSICCLPIVFKDDMETLIRTCAPAGQPRVWSTSKELSHEVPQPRGWIRLGWPAHPPAVLPATCSPASKSAAARTLRAISWCPLTIAALSQRSDCPGEQCSSWISCFHFPTVSGVSCTRLSPGV